MTDEINKYDEEGFKHGFWKIYYYSKLEEGCYKHGLKDSVWKYYRRDGSLHYEYNYENGSLMGPWKEYYENGQLTEEGSYYEDNPIGLWRYMDKNENLKKETYYIK